MGSKRGQKVNTRYIKDEFLEVKPRYRQPTGVLVTRLATLFAMIVTIATLVMLIGK